jgi:Ca-activated chloride channel family protein
VLRQLGPADAFTVVTYSSASEVVLPIQQASEANKAAARTAIETIEEDGGTCISCGLDSAAAEVARSPISGGVQRLLVISDGQANEGVYQRDELAALTAGHAAHGTSISTVGVGLDFDEQTMRRLAEVGRGNYYFVEDTVALSTMFARELEALGHVVAADLRVAITAAPGTTILEAYGYPMDRSGGGMVVPIADLRAGETRKLVLRVHVDRPASEAVAIARVDATWRQVADATRGHATVSATAEVDASPDAIAASTDPAVVQAIEEALSARALDDASATYDKDGVEGAQRVLRQRVQDVRAKARYLPKQAIEKLESAAGDASGEFAKAPAKAKKAASVKAYELAR